MVKYEEMKEVLKNVSAIFDESYICLDGFRVVYNEVKGTAIYHSEKTTASFEVKVTTEEKDAFIRTRYWVKV